MLPLTPFRKGGWEDLNRTELLTDNFPLDLMVNGLYHFGMETKDDLIKAAIRELLRVAKKYARIEKLPIRVEEGVEITTQEAHMIQAVGEHKKMSVTDVAIHFGVTKSAASQLATKLAGKGFLQKRQAPHSNKELELSLTQLGWRAFDAHEHFHGADMTYITNRLSVFSLQQIATLSVLLEAIGSIMDERLTKE
ncbi:MarR family winged helix-turn-helix transcriptional regulator [Desulfomonile tiedjei]|uniref:Transcriptional regulator n=1 Tax=Desulfomonile tiedjei (strain ATCC 49306 / DSM 6799 / DCB-1) TaxID=706587 RepID=I4C2M5_DESTA|nr:MarR family transcriptional regulator [Desulfomonile tiedjei]AFM23816.1 transcriptional regulator [Desulfomonile tiedjei DSM 6799]